MGSGTILGYWVDFLWISGLWFDFWLLGRFLAFWTFFGFFGQFLSFGLIFGFWVNVGVVGKILAIGPIFCRFLAFYFWLLGRFLAFLYHFCHLS